MITRTWKKSSYSGSTNNECVRGRLDGDHVRLGDTKAPASGDVVVSRGGFAGLLTVLKDQQAR